MRVNANASLWRNFHCDPIIASLVSTLHLWKDFVVVQQTSSLSYEVKAAAAS